MAKVKSPKKPKPIKSRFRASVHNDKYGKNTSIKGAENLTIKEAVRLQIFIDDAIWWLWHAKIK